MSKEEWRDVKGYERLYQVSNMGRVKSFHYDLTAGRIMKPIQHSNGYYVVMLYRNGDSQINLIHRLVARAFVKQPSPDRDQVNHKNGSKADNRAENLEWVTRQQNIRHRHEILGMEYGKPPVVRGGANGQSKLTRRDVKEIRRLYATGKYTQQELAEIFGVTQVNIGFIVRRETWKHIP